MVEQGDLSNNDLKLILAHRKSKLEERYQNLDSEKKGNGWLRESPNNVDN